MQSAAFADSAVGEGIRSLLEEEFAGELPEGYGPARFRSPATRSRTARCAGPAPTSCSDRSSIPRRR